MAEHPYEVFNPQAQLVMYSPAECRYPAKIELEMLEAGYAIRFHGKRLTKTDIRKEAQSSVTKKRNNPKYCTQLSSDKYSCH